MTLEHDVKTYYTSSGLEKDTDELHLGGRKATEYLLAALHPGKDRKILDIGCGVGGAARAAAQLYGACVTGIDLVPDYIEKAESLTRQSGLPALVSFRAGSALSLPFADNNFDAAYTIHAAMNIQDKKKFYAEAFRVLKPGALFGIYDILSCDGNSPDFPVPWAKSSQTSFLATLPEMEKFLREAGFEILSREDRQGFALETLRRLEEKQKEIPESIANLARAVREKTCGPWQIICRR